MKESSAQIYASALTSFCEFLNVADPDSLIELGIDKIETLMQEWINENRNKLAPKYLNLVYCSVKRWYQIHGLIKSTKMFREIKFDKSSRKTDALTETMLETKHVKAGFKSDNYREVYYKIKCLFRHPSIRFNGRPYLLRKYADRIPDRITKIYNDEDTKEFLMRHNGKISSIYQITGLTKEREKELRDMYVNACDRWISRNIFETASQEEIDKAETLIIYSQQIAELSEDKVEALRQAFRKGTLTFEGLQVELGKLTRQALDSKMEQKLEQLFLKMNAKYNNQ